MQNLKTAGFFILSIFLVSCSKQDQTTLKQKVDTTTSKIGKEIDTLVGSISKGDTLFEKVTITQVDTSNLLDEEVRGKINNIFDEYIDIKEALADNDSTLVQKNAKEMLDVIVIAQNEVGDNVDKKLKFTPGKIDKISKQIESAGSLDQQRAMFKELSSSMTEVIQKYGLSNKTIYQLECKDDASGKGGTWLADTKSSDNPYFGNVKDKDSVECAQVKNAWDFD